MEEVLREESEAAVIIIGIDNGSTGGAAIIWGGTQAPSVYPAPTVPGSKPPVLDERGMVSILGYAKEGGPVHAFVEIVHFLPKQSSQAGGKYGIGHGLWRGMLVALGIPYTLVLPQTWQKAMLAGMAYRGNTKPCAIERAHQLFPGVNLRASERCRCDHDGMADALLIAEYGRRQVNG